MTSKLSDALLLSHLQQAIVVVCDQALVIRIEGGFEQIFGQSKDSFIGEPLATLGLDIYTAEIFARLQKGQSSVIIRDVAVADQLGSLESLDLTGVPLSDSGGSMSAYMLSFVPRKWAGHVTEQVTDLSGAAKTIKGLSAMLAHEIKNPLSGIKGAAQLLARRVPEDQLKLTDMVVSEVDRISRLVDDLEGFTNPDEGDLGAVNVHECLDQAMTNIRAGIGRDISFRRLYDPSLPQLLGRVDPLVQILLNVIKNAIEASDAGGRITIRTRYQHSLWMNDGRGERKKCPIEVCIEDEGCGVSADMRHHLFDPFITDKEGGSGLGLAMVAQHMMAMGAIIRCEDNQPRGTRLHLYFQAAD